MPDLSLLHFLRPAWFLGMLPVAVFVIVLSLRGNPERQWRGTIAPHLLAHLRVGVKGRSWFRPLHLFAAFGVLSVVALAGPSPATRLCMSG